MWVFFYGGEALSEVRNENRCMLKPWLEIPRSRGPEVIVTPAKGLPPGQVGPLAAVGQVSLVL